MPHTYTPSPVELTIVTEPSDGDLESAASLTTATRAIADGIAFEKARFAPLANLAALIAITTPDDGLVKHVIGFGWYVFKTSATTGYYPFRIAATDATPGGWVSSTAHETSRQVLINCAEVAGISSDSAGSRAESTPGTGPHDFGGIAMADADIGAGFYPLCVFTGATKSFAFLLPLDAYMHDGATLTEADLYLRPVSGHGALPTRQPQIAIVRTSRFGYSPTPEALKSTGGGLAQLAAVSTVAYEDDNVIAFVANQNNVIDRTVYTYSAFIWDEGGTNAIVGNRFAALRLTFTMTDARQA